jgi:hypothetical protein
MERGASWPKGEFGISDSDKIDSQHGTHPLTKFKFFWPATDKIAIFTSQKGGCLLEPQTPRPIIWVHLELGNGLPCEEGYMEGCHRSIQELTVPGQLLDGKNHRSTRRC